MKRKVKSSLFLVLAVMLALCITVIVGSKDAYASGTKTGHGDLYASDLEGYDTLYIDGNTRIHLADGDDITLKCIRLDYNNNNNLRELIIDGSNAGTLRITGSAEYGCIQTTGNGNLFIRGGHVIVGSDDVSSSILIGPGGLLQISDGILEIKATKTDTYNTLTAINVERFFLIEKGILSIDISGAGGATGITASNLSISGGRAVIKVSASGNDKTASGIKTPSSVDGNYYFSGGDVYVEAKAPKGTGYGIRTLFNQSSSNYVNISDGTLRIYGSAYGIDTATDNDVNIRGSSAVTVTAGTHCALLCGGNLDIREQAVLKASVEDCLSSSSHWSSYGTVYSKDYPYIYPVTSKIVEPAEGKWTENSSGASYITDKNGTKAKEVVVGPITNDNAIDPAQLSINGNAFSSEKLYYENIASATTGSASSWNAHYEPETGTLYLRNYQGGNISVNYSATDKKLIIELIGNNSISKTWQFGIVALGNDLEITSVLQGSLSISGYHESTTHGGSAGIATHWSGDQEKGTITVSGNAVLNIDIGSNEEVFGIWADEDIVIEDHAKVDVKVSYGDDAYPFFSGIGAYGGFTVLTDKTVNASIYSRDNWSNTMSRNIYAFYLPNYSDPNGSRRFDLLNAEYISFSYVGKDNEGYASNGRLLEALNNGLASEYELLEFAGNDAKSAILRVKGRHVGDIPVTGAYFPDPEFSQVIKEEADANNDGWLTQSEIDSVTSIIYSDASDLDVHSIAGIEQFRNLEHFTWAKGNIRTLELPVNNRQMEHLQTVRVHKNHLEKVDVSGLDDLNGLDINTNKELEWSNILVNPGLQILDASDCGFDSIDISAMTELTMFGCNNNNLTSLDVSRNKKLQALYCSGTDITPTNKIASLDLTGLTDLQHVECQHNGMKTLILASHPDLNVLYCYGNDLDTLYLNGSPVIKDAYLNGTHETGQYFERYQTDDADLKIDGTVTIVAEPLIIKAYGGSLSLEGDIGINFKMVIPDEVFADAGAYVTLDDLIIPMSSAKPCVENGIAMYEFKYRVAAKEMNREVTFRAYTGSGEPITLQRYSSGNDITDTGYKYSVQKYIKAVIKNSSVYPANLVALVKAMSDYGSKAQMQFGYFPETAAEINNQAAISAVTMDDLEPYRRVTTKTDRLGIVYTSANLTLESETTARLFYRVDQGTIDDYSFTVNGLPVSSHLETDGHAVEIPNIAAKDLDKMNRVEASDSQGVCLTVQYSALSYAYLIVKNESTQPQTLVELVKTMYVYNQAADAYFGN